MRKIIILAVISVFTSFITNAQEREYSKGKWYLGPHVGITNNIPSIKGYDFTNGYNVGAFGGYSFTNLLGINSGALYSWESSLDFRQEYLKIPAIFMLHFKQVHFGLGLQYNLSISDIGYLNLKTSNMSYVSGIFEFGFNSPYLPLPGGGIIYIGFSTRYIFRVGYALYPWSYSTQGGVVGGVIQDDYYFEYRPFFIEFALQYNIGQHFSIFNSKTKETVVRRR